MAYERTNWQNGDVISSEKLNKMEAGIEYACSLEHEVEDPTEGQVLKYDAEKGKFVNGDVAIETNIQNPTDGQTLKYDAESGKWVNGEGGSAAPLIVNLIVDENTHLLGLDKTWQEIYDAFPNVKVHNIETNELDMMVEIWQPLSGVRILPDSEPKRYSVMGEFGDGELYASSPNDYPNADSGSEDPLG